MWSPDSGPWGKLFRSVEHPDIEAGRSGGLFILSCMRSCTRLARSCAPRQRHHASMLRAGAGNFFSRIDRQTNSAR